MKTHTVTRIISVPPSKINKAKAYISSEITTNVIGTCSKSDGYIIDISGDFKIISNTTVPGWIRFTVQFDIVSLIPVENDEYTGKVVAIFEEHVFAIFNGKMKVLVMELEPNK